MHWLHLLLSFWRFWSFLLQVIMKHFLQTLCCRFHLHYFLLYFLFYVDSSLVLNVSQLYLTNCACLLILLLLIVGPTLRTSLSSQSSSFRMELKSTSKTKTANYVSMQIWVWHCQCHMKQQQQQQQRRKWVCFERLSRCHIWCWDLISATALLSVWNAHELFF